MEWLKLQLSLFDNRTEIECYLSQVKYDVKISKKISKSINSKGFYIITYENKNLCYVQIKKHDDYFQLQIRSADDWQGVSMPCQGHEISYKLNRKIGEYIERR